MTNKKQKNPERHENRKKITNAFFVEEVIVKLNTY